MRHGFRLTLLGLILFVGAGCSHSGSGPGSVIPAQNGQVVSNGGGFLEALFEQGRLQAVRLLSRVSATDAQYLPSDYLAPGELTWLVQHAKRLADDIEHSEHRWLGELPRGECPAHECACAPPSASDQVLLSLTGCHGFKHAPQAGELLIHESVHHLCGPDEPKARRIASALYEIWRSWRSAAKGGWSEMAPVPDSVDAYAPSGFDRGKLWILNGPDQLLTYDPLRNRWEVQALDNVSLLQAFQHGEEVAPWFSLAPAGEPMPLAWLGSQLVLYQPLAPKVGAPSTGIFLDSAHRRWQLLPPSMRPAWGGQARVLSASEDFLVWWHSTFASNGNGRFWRYRPFEGSWQRLSEVNSPPYPLPKDPSTALTASENSVAVWGGKDDPQGAIYDEKQDHWTPIERRGAPAPREAFTLLLAGSKLLVVGGYDTHGDFQVGGRLYDPSLGWRAMSETNSPRVQDGYTPLQAVWTGSQAIFKVSGLHLYDPSSDEWRVVPYPAGNVPYNAKLFWTGSELIVWDRERGGYLFEP